MKKLLAVLMAVLIVASLAGCEKAPKRASAPACLKLELASSATLEVNHEGFRAPKILYVSEREDIVSIDKNGRLSAVGPGNCRVWSVVKSNNKDAVVCETMITVVDPAGQTTSYGFAAMVEQLESDERAVLVWAQHEAWGAAELPERLYITMYVPQEGLNEKGEPCFVSGYLERQAAAKETPGAKKQTGQYKGELSLLPAER